MTRRKRKPSTADEPMPMTRLELLAKASVAAGDAVDEATAIEAIKHRNDKWADLMAVEAPYDPETMLKLTELTPHLCPNLEAYSVNIDGYGHRMVPVEAWMKDLDSDEARDTIRNALEFERWIDSQDASLADQETKKVEEEGQGEQEVGDEDDDLFVSDEEVDQTIENLKDAIRREHFIAKAWFKNCCSTMSFERLRRVTRWDKEAVGWSCIEMITDGYGRLRRLNYVPAHTVRPVDDSGELVEVVEPDPVTPLSENREVRVRRRFPRYVQSVNEKKVYFKSPGDPRVVSRYTGYVYKDIKEMERNSEKEGDDPKPANAMLWISHHNPTTPCSPPRWAPALLRVLGTREADETNYYHLKNKTMSSGILFVSGGRVPGEVKERIERSLIAELQGSRNTSRILVVEALPMKGAPSDRSMLPQLEYKSLRDAHQTDGMFSEYDARAADTIGAAFRQSPLLRGYTPSDLNRATADAALRFTETQVYEPERRDFDWSMNKHIIPNIGIKYLMFESLGPPARSADEIGEFVKSVAPHGGLLPHEIRDLAASALNTSLESVQEEWTKHPMAMTLAGIPASGAVHPEDDEAGDIVAQRLRQVEERVAMIATGELRDAGLDDITARAYFVGRDKDEEDEGE